jgi:hypothetical protein
MADRKGQCIDRNYGDRPPSPVKLTHTGVGTGTAPKEEKVDYQAEDYRIRMMDAERKISEYAHLVVALTRHVESLLFPIMPSSEYKVYVNAKGELRYRWLDGEEGELETLIDMSREFIRDMHDCLVATGHAVSLRDGLITGPGLCEEHPAEEPIKSTHVGRGEEIAAKNAQRLAEDSGEELARAVLILLNYERARLSRVEEIVSKLDEEYEARNLTLAGPPKRLVGAQRGNGHGDKAVDVRSDTQRGPAGVPTAGADEG